MSREQQPSPPELEAELRGLLDDYRDAVDMPDAAFERGLARVQASAGAAGTAAASSGLASGPASGPAGWLTVGAVSLVGVGAIVAIVALSGGDAPTERVDPPLLSTQTEPEALGQHSESDGFVPPPLPPPPPAPRSHRSASARVADPSPAARKPASAPPPALDADSLARETELLRSAQAALNRGRPDAALASVQAHAKAFPNGVLAEERRALEVVALCESGQATRGHKRARAFVRAFPNSTSKARVLSACPTP